MAQSLGTDWETERLFPSVHEDVSSNGIASNAFRIPLGLFSDAED